MQLLMVVSSLLATIGLIASPVSGNGTLPPFPVSFAWPYLTSSSAVGLRDVEEGVAIRFGEANRALAPRGKQPCYSCHTLYLSDCYAF